MQVTLINDVDDVIIDETISLFRSHIPEKWIFFGALFFCSVSFYVRLLDYIIYLKARHDELIHELITLHHHELI